MKKRLSVFIPCIIVFLLDFYLLPLAIRNTGAAMLLMLFVVPLIAFICSLIFGVRHGFAWMLPIIAATLFAPTLFIYYDPSAWIYIIAYAVVVLAGNGIGRAFHGKR